MAKPSKDLFQEFLETGWDAFDSYRVTLLVDDLVGGIPKDPDLLEGWVDATNKEASAERRLAIVKATKAQLPAVSEEEIDRKSVGFKSDEGGLYIEGRQIKAMLKENANVMKEGVVGTDKKNRETKGITALKSKVAERLFVEEKKIYLGKSKPDEIEERPIHVVTAQGPRTALKRVEIVRNVKISFTLKRQRGNVVPESAVLAILAYGRDLGLGADRSQGRGRFEVVEVVKLEGGEALKRRTASGAVAADSIEAESATDDASSAEGSAAGAA